MLFFQRAANLSKALQEVLKENTFQNFEAYYFDFDFRAGGFDFGTSEK